jgi:hypothetical protein
LARQPRTFKYTCPNCGRQQTVNCKHCHATYVFDPTRQPGEKLVGKKVYFGQRQWDQIVARAKVTPAVNGPGEFVRLACAEVLAMPPVRLISS